MQARRYRKKMWFGATAKSWAGTPNCGRYSIASVVGEGLPCTGFQVYQIPEHRQKLDP